MRHYDLMKGHECPRGSASEACMAAPDRHRRGTAEVRPFHVRLVEGRRRTVLEFTGDCDMATHRHARDAIDAAWATGTSSIVIDLTGVEFMDSSGVMHLLEAQ